MVLIAKPLNLSAIYAGEVMQLFIMRHGEAEGFAGHTFKRDNERQLTKQGVSEAQLMANCFLEMNINFSHVFTSPYIRAQQTCAEVLKVFELNAVTLDFITPSGDAKQVHDFIDGLLSAHEKEQSKEANLNKDKGIEKSLLIVSHMPLVSYLVSELTFDAQTPIFATAGVAQIEYNTVTMRGELVRMVSPSDFC
jgi:phosphohistidine phosphatase